MKLFGFKFQALGGQNEIQLYANERDVAERLAKSAIEEILRVEKKYSTFLDTSITAEIRRGAGRRTVEIDEETASLVDYAEACFNQSDGLFDITTGPLRKIWDFKNKVVPTSDDVNAALRFCGFNKMTRPSWLSLFLPIPGMDLDFGGFGKEYAVDRAATILSEQGVGSALINLGGDVRALGPHPNGSPWEIGIAHPRKAGEIVSIAPLYIGALATSGDYERYFEIDGRRYCHIINPKTGFPAQELQSVTVLAETCLAAGTLSTIAMLVGEKAAKDLLEDYPHILVNQSGQRIKNVLGQHVLPSGVYETVPCS